ncbi:hypothetical protein FAM09_01080 [Niastella caeni]|uniref:DUF4890 domain-containing protein n=1 Tax=Niastella caeni TaxID=2569763 RepID=A0A4S8HYD0_9BACT|nr:hypothetical protein [Niastella caeni]THU40737.1 hypothetical protein FAM09_01080 [Niastella caeni]
MKWVQLLLLVMLIGMGTTATAQQRLVNNQEMRQRMSELQLTLEQKRRLAELIRRERMQYYLNQKALNEILTEKQKAILLNWRSKRDGLKCDSIIKKR